MSDTFPSSPGFSSTSLFSNQSVHATIGDSGRRQSRVLGGHLWEAKCTFPKLLHETMIPVTTFMARQRGDSFQIAIQPYDTPNGTISGSVLVNGATSAGSSTLPIHGLGATDTYLAGSCFNVSGHTKTYMVTDDSVAIAGAMTISITPPLIADVANGEVVTYTGVKFTMAAKGDIARFKTDAPKLSSYSLDLIEALP